MSEMIPYGHASHCASPGADVPRPWRSLGKGEEEQTVLALLSRSAAGDYRNLKMPRAVRSAASDCPDFVRILYQ